MIQIKDNTIIMEHKDSAPVETVMAWKAALMEAIQFLPDDTEQSTYYKLAEMLKAFDLDYNQLSKALKTN